MVSQDVHAGGSEFMESAAITAKWTLAPADLPDELRATLRSGDEAASGGDWATAAQWFERALAADPANAVARIGLAQANVAAGRAAAAVAELEHLVTECPGEAVARHYLASAWYALAIQVRGVTRNDELVVTSAEQLDTCQQAAERIITLDVADPELMAGARALLAESEAGRLWMWDRPTLAIFLGGLVVAAGLISVVLGGRNGSVFAVVIGAVLGAVALFVVVVVFRRQSWQLRARRMAPLIWRWGTTV